MSLSLERVVYSSTATGTTDSILNLAVILAELQRNNDRDGLSGALAAHRDRYIQVLEGPAQTLDGLLRRLATDPRHRDIVVLDRVAITARLFGQWSMASARINPAQAAALDALMAGESLNAEDVIKVMRTALDTAGDDRVGKPAAGV